METAYKMTRPLKERFEEKYIPITESGCWIWVGSLGTYGYGQISINNKPIGAHRVSYELYKGPIPKGMSVLHKCDILTCINPDHLFLGTQKDNVQDCINKGRDRKARGEENGHSKLTEYQVKEIRSSTKTGVVLSNRYGVSTSVISNIRRRKTWKWL